MSRHYHHHQKRKPEPEPPVKTTIVDQQGIGNQHANSGHEADKRHTDQPRFLDDDAGNGCAETGIQQAERQHQREIRHAVNEGHRTQDNHRQKEQGAHYPPHAGQHTVHIGDDRRPSLSGGGCIDHSRNEHQEPCEIPPWIACKAYQQEYRYGERYSAVSVKQEFVAASDLHTLLRRFNHPGDELQTLRSRQLLLFHDTSIKG